MLWATLFYASFSRFLLRRFLYRLGCLLCLVFISVHSNYADIYQENLGLVVMEIESAPLIGKWESRTILSGYLGTSYLFPTESSASGGVDVLNYTFSISTPGNYQVQIRSRIGEGTSNTDFNDGFLRLIDSKANPVNPVSNENTVTGSWYKFYQNVLNNWTWQTSNKDNDPKSISWNLIPSTYTLQISRRSKAHALDKIVLWENGQNSLGDNTGRTTSAQATSLNNLPISKTTDISGIFGYSNKVTEKNNFELYFFGDGKIEISNQNQVPYNLTVTKPNGKIIFLKKGVAHPIYMLSIPSHHRGLVIVQLNVDGNLTNRVGIVH